MPIFEARLDPTGITTGAAEAKKAINQVGDSFDGMERKGVEASDKISSALGKLAKGAVAAFGVYKAFDWGKGAVLAAGQYETLGVAMYQVGMNAGYSRQQMDAFDFGLQKAGIAMKESRQLLTRLA